MPPALKAAILDFTWLHIRRHAVLHTRTDIAATGSRTLCRAWLYHGASVTTIAYSVDASGTVSRTTVLWHTALQRVVR